MARLTQSTTTTIARCWAADLGCPSEHLQTSRTLVVPHSGLGDYHGVFVFRFGEAVVVSVPLPLLAGLRPRFAQFRAAQLTPEICIRTVSETAVERVIGPAYYGYADATSLRPLESVATRALTPFDVPHLERLRTACSDAEWEESGALTMGQSLVGQFVNGELVAVAGYHIWWDCLAHLCVITHPGYRGRGYGKAVAGYLGETTLQRGLIPQYRALETNRSSIAIATALGFEQCATSIALRLKPHPIF